MVRLQLIGTVLGRFGSRYVLPPTKLLFDLVAEQHTALQVHEISAKTDGGNTITWPTDNMGTVNFPVPKSVPSGEYLVRIEHIALHSAGSANGAQFYVCHAGLSLLLVQVTYFTL